MAVRTEPRENTTLPTSRVGHRRRRISTAHWIFVGPAAALFAIFFGYPLVASVIQSLHSNVGGQQVWVGLQQYDRLVHDPLMHQALTNTALILIVQVPIMIGLALVLAQVLNTSFRRVRSTFRLAYFLPAVTTLVAYAIVFRVLLKTDGGMVNQFLDLLGMPGIDWLNSPGWARIAVIASLTWRWTGYNVVILLAGLQAVPKELYEAAAIDGAGPISTFFRIVVPQLRPILLFTTVTSTIGTLQLFDEVYILTGGGPANATLTPVLYLYQVGFEQLDFGYASAIAWVVVAITGVISFVQFRVLGRSKP